MLKEMLEQEGFLVMLRSGAVPHLGASGPYEVLVPEAEAEEAHEILAELLARMPARRPPAGRPAGAREARASDGGERGSKDGPRTGEDD
ncbi:MAG: DUF2007 domain-containing protein [Firmicutes bacterium]|nr:DUF2007 domain-containing protein [Bacillota bacterium]